MAKNLYARMNRTKWKFLTSEYFQSNPKFRRAMKNLVLTDKNLCAMLDKASSSRKSNANFAILNV